MSCTCCDCKAKRGRTGDTGATGSTGSGTTGATGATGIGATGATGATGAAGGSFLKWSGQTIDGVGFAADGAAASSNISSVPQRYYPPAGGQFNGFSINLPFLGVGQTFQAELLINGASVATIVAAAAGPTYAAAFVAAFGDTDHVSVRITSNQADLYFTAMVSLA